MPLNVYEFSEAGSNRVAVAVAESAEAAERLANRMSPGRNWTSIEQVRWREDYHSKCFSGMPAGESYCEMNHPG
jgi:hypothetical protein